MPELKAHINKFISIPDAEYLKLSSFFKPVTIPKKNNLLTEGKICNANYFVVKGCLRMFFVNDKGIEHTVQFALENWWLADYASFANRKPSEFYIQTVEDCELLLLEFAAQEEMLKRFPQMERYFRLVHQRAHAASQHRMKIMYSTSREQMYHNFSRQFPEFVQRIPQYLLASYLGFTPEYLSEIRRKKLS